MLKLEQQVCNLELAKRLKELNCPQDSLFYWWGTFNYRPYPQPEQYEEHEKERAYQDQDWQVSLKKDIFDEDSRSWKGMYKNTLDIFSAFSVAELGEMLPSGAITSRTASIAFPAWICNFHTLGGVENEYGDLEHIGNRLEAETEADARAKMLIWLIEEGYITQ